MKRMRYDWSQFRRPPLATTGQPLRDTILFQELEVDHYIGNAYPGMPGPQSGSVPIIRMFGITKTDNSVCCHVHGFSPYFHVNVPATFSTSDLAPFKSALNAAVLADEKFAILSLAKPEESEISEAFLRVELVRGKSLVGYTGEVDKNFAKITVVLPIFISFAKRLLTTQTVYEPLKNHTFYAYEADVDFETRFMVDTNILGCCWIEVPAKKWLHRSEHSTLPITSRCQIEIDVSWKDFIAHAPEGEWASVAKFRILSFDIECAVRGAIIPNPNIDAVFQIGTIVRLYGAREVVCQTIFTVKSCAPIANTKVFSFIREEEMLLAWADFIRQVDPDVVTGYNILNFDISFLIRRANHLKLNNFNCLGRILSIESEIKYTVKIGNMMYPFINFVGRVLYDMILVVRRDLNLKSNRLDEVCKEILGMGKDGVHFTMIKNLQNGDEQTRRRLAVYCLKDTELPMRLLEKLSSFTNDIEISRITGLHITGLLYKGEHSKGVAHLLRHSVSAGYFVPDLQCLPVKKRGSGAIAPKPQKSNFAKPIVSLNFSCFNPSIMIAHNICYTTFLDVSDRETLRLTNDQVSNTLGCMFVKPTVRLGLLPHILQDLLTSWKNINTLLENATDPLTKLVLKSRWLAYKKAANSLYRFIEPQVSALPYPEIYKGVTAYGFDVIKCIKQEIEHHYSIENGYETDAKVIYSDSDSVMVNFNVKDPQKCINLGEEAAMRLSTNLKLGSLKLELNKVTLI